MRAGSEGSLCAHSLGQNNPRVETIKEENEVESDMSTIVQKIECLSRAGGLPGAENDTCSFHVEEQAVALGATEKDAKRGRGFFL